MGYLEAQNRRSANNFLRSGTKCLFNLNSRCLIMYLVATQDKWNVIFLCSNATSLINTISVTAWLLLRPQLKAGGPISRENAATKQKIEILNLQMSLSLKRPSRKEALNAMLVCFCAVQDDSAYSCRLTRDLRAFGWETLFKATTHLKSTEITGYFRPKDSI